MRRLRLVPETAPQSGVLLTWPHLETDWKHSLESVETCYCELAARILCHEALLVVCHDVDHREHVRELLAQSGQQREAVRFCIAPTNDTWIRDYGPLTVSTGTGLRLLDFAFDGWGKKYPANLDNEVTARLCTAGVFGATPCQRDSFILEGGSIDTDGHGTLLTTSRCLLANNRNPGYDRQAMEQLFAQHMGIENILWVEHGGLEGDDTDAHIDILARFCSPRIIAYTSCADTADDQHAELTAMERQLGGFRDLCGQPYHLVALPLPQPIRNAAQQRLPASYTNFLVINGAVLVPVYDDPADSLALEKLAGCFPDREIVAVNCLPLIQQFGSLHCATMQLPEGVL
ncbi:MAG: agmatine deiminase family protein [Gammaproteobacteria bacterium]|jgi:agmatine/peptidylarginine deiminase